MKPAEPVAEELTWGQVHAFRLTRHHLAARAPKRDLVNVTAHIGGAQAQVMSAAEMQIAVRSEASAADVRAALWRTRTLVKTWLMRATLHLVPARDLPVYTAALSGGWVRTRPSWLKYLGVSEVELHRLIDDIGATMNGEPMTREEIIAVAGNGQPARVREWMKSGWGGFLKPVARAGLLCFGPSRGQSVTFVNPREWLGGWRDVDPYIAIAEIARRYLHAFGPATRQDFTFWWGHWPGVGNAAWAALEGELATVSVAGRRAQMLASDLDHIPPAMKGSVQLLGPFDPYLMGWASREHLFDSEHRARVSRTAGWISAVVLVDGRVEGTWTHRVAKDVLQVEVTPLVRLPAAALTKVRQRAGELARAMDLAKAGVKVL